MSYEPQHDLDWQAFLYVSGEMIDADLQAFEGRLAEDQSAREAVAQAVELLSKMTAGANSGNAIAIANVQPVGGRTIFAAIATAAALVLVCFSLTRRPLSEFDSEPVRELVSLWSGSADLSEDWSETDLSPVAASEEADDLAIPGWMLAAVEPSPDNKPAKKED